VRLWLLVLGIEKTMKHCENRRGHVNTGEQRFPEKFFGQTLHYSRWSLFLADVDDASRFSLQVIFVYEKPMVLLQCNSFQNIMQNAESGQL
jgi:hypothetical protein